jgi:iron complex outermembrane recepter protein
VTWKGGGVWQPIEGVRLRGTVSRDIRAPNVPELFSGVVQATGSVIDRGATTPIIVASQGNPALNPEKADTLTGGIVLSPGFAPGLTLSVDYYSIDIKGVISALTPQQTLDQCNAGAASLCSSITRNGAGTITRIQSPTLNLNRQKTAGIDFELDYHPNAELLGGKTGLRFLASYLAKQSLTLSGAKPIDYAGAVGQTGGGYSNNPRWTATANLDWSKGRFELFAQERFISAGTYDVTRVEPKTIADNHVKSVFYTDVTLGYHVNENFRFFLTVNNLFDRDPPLAPTGTLITFVPTNQQLYDVIGRRFTAGVNLKF